MTLRSYPAVLIFLALCFEAFGQIALGDKEVRIAPDLPQVKARTADPTDVLAASLEMILQDKAICCGKDSALEASLEKANPQSLQDVAQNLQGRHLLGDGRPILVSVVHLSPEQVSAGAMIVKLRENRAALMMWDSHLYVIDGMTYIESPDGQGGTTYLIHKFSLQDPRYSDSRRHRSFDRVTDNTSKIQGILFIQAALQ